MRKVIQNDQNGGRQNTTSSGPFTLYMHGRHADVAGRLKREAPMASVNPPESLRRTVFQRLSERESVAKAAAGVEPYENRLRVFASVAFACIIVMVVAASVRIQYTPFGEAYRAGSGQTATTPSSAATAQWLQRLFEDAAAAHGNEIQDPLTHELQALMHDARDARAFMIRNVPFAASLAHHDSRSRRSPGPSAHETMQ